MSRDFMNKNNFYFIIGSFVKSRKNPSPSMGEGWGEGEGDPPPLNPLPPLDGQARGGEMGLFTSSSRFEGISTANRER
jgi:hypothetical protein